MVIYLLWWLANMLFSYCDETEAVVGSYYDVWILCLVATLMVLG